MMHEIASVLAALLMGIGPHTADAGDGRPHIGTVISIDRAASAFVLAERGRGLRAGPVERRITVGPATVFASLERPGRRAAARGRNTEVVATPRPAWSLAAGAAVIVRTRQVGRHREAVHVLVSP
jgi:hypothetical protein